MFILSTDKYIFGLNISIFGQKISIFCLEIHIIGLDICIFGQKIVYLVWFVDTISVLAAGLAVLAAG